MGKGLVNAHRNWQLWIPIGVVLALGLLGIATQTYFRYTALDNEQREMANQAVSLASQSIDQTLQEERHLLLLFTQQHTAVLNAVKSTPGSAPSREALARKIRQYFPEAFAHTLADKNGNVLMEYFDGLVAEDCRNNIRAFARTGEQQLRMHANPLKPHYDIMAQYGDCVFFVSFDPHNISGLLSEYALHGLRLYLLKGSGPQVDIAGLEHQGPQRHAITLSAQEQGAILAAAYVPHTDWRLVALPMYEHLWAERLAIRVETAGLVVTLVLFSLAFHMLLVREHRQRLHAELEAQKMAHLGLVDALTGLPNRRALDIDLEREWLNMERSDEPLSLLMIDLDHFKDYNDTYGHLAGDNCLRVVAQTMRSTLKRPRDRIARFGGEEFAILLPNTPCLAAKLLADALHEAVRDAFSIEAAEPGVTISIGISCAHAKHLNNAQELLDVADQALYGAKGAGRDTTVTIPIQT